MKKTTKKLAAIMAAMLAVATVGASATMPVFAQQNAGDLGDNNQGGDQGGGNQGESGGNDSSSSTGGLITVEDSSAASLPVTKILNVDTTNSVAPQTTFTFHMVGIDEYNKNTAGYTKIDAKATDDSGNYPLYTGTTTTLTTKITFAGTETPVTDSDAGTETITGADTSTGASAFDLSGLTFTKAGIYRYIVWEEAPTTDATLKDDGTIDQDGKLSYVTYDDTTFTVDLYVEKEGSGDAATFAIKYIVSTASGDSKKPIIFSNGLCASELEITKKLSGNGHTENAKYTFCVEIDPQPGLPKGTELLTDIPEDPEASVKTYRKLTVGEHFDVALGDQDTLTVYGIYKDTTYTVSEIANGCTGTYVLEPGAEESKEDKIGTAEDTTDHTGLSVVVSDKIVDGTNTLTVTNTKMDTNTGVVLTVTPIAIAGGLAAAGAVAVVLKRKLKK
jgi:hypothetical protein